MNYSRRMGRRKTLSDAAACLKHFAKRHGTLPQVLAECLSLQKFGNDIGRPLYRPTWKIETTLG